MSGGAKGKKKQHEHDRTELSEKFRRYFKIPTTLVAVSISKDAVKADGNPARYCGMVRRTAHFGDSFTVTTDNLTCANAVTALGFAPVGDNELPHLDAGTRAIHIEPLDTKGGEPDVVLIASNPRKLMGISTLLSKALQKPVEFSVRGDVAVCGEGTAIPIVEGRANISLLCNGARVFSGYRDDEMVLGIPYPMFAEFTSLLSEEQITEAMCGCIMDDMPKQVIDSFLSFGFTKGTDHFAGRFEGEIIRLYPLKDTLGRVRNLSLHLPLRLDTAEDASRVESSVDWPPNTPLNAAARGEWLDVTMLLDLNEPLDSAVTRGEAFHALLREGMKTLIDEGRNLEKSGKAKH